MLCSSSRTYAVKNVETTNLCLLVQEEPAAPAAAAAALTSQDPNVQPTPPGVLLALGPQLEKVGGAGGAGWLGSGRSVGLHKPAAGLDADEYIRGSEAPPHTAPPCPYLLGLVSKASQPALPPTPHAPQNPYYLVPLLGSSTLSLQNQAAAAQPPVVAAAVVSSHLELVAAGPRLHQLDVLLQVRLIAQRLTASQTAAVACTLAMWPACGSCTQYVHALPTALLCSLGLHPVCALLPPTANAGAAVRLRC